MKGQYSREKRPYLTLDGNDRQRTEYFTSLTKKVSNEFKNIPHIKFSKELSLWMTIRCQSHCFFLGTTFEWGDLQYHMHAGSGPFQPGAPCGRGYGVSAGPGIGPLCQKGFKGMDRLNVFVVSKNASRPTSNSGYVPSILWSNPRSSWFEMPRRKNIPTSFFSTALTKRPSKWRRVASQGSIFVK